MAWEIGDPVTQYLNCFVAKNRFLQTPRLPNPVGIIHLPLIIPKFRFVRERWFVINYVCILLYYGGNINAFPGRSALPISRKCRERQKRYGTRA